MVCGDGDAVLTSRHKHVKLSRKSDSIEVEDSEVQRMEKRNQLLLTHPVADSRMLGRT